MELKVLPQQEAFSFNLIAKKLINKYVLLVNGNTIELCDLEFYWNDGNDHKDHSTHFHSYQHGQLRPHGAGYDISLRDESGYGGILIRGIIKDGIPTYGPIRSADVIFRAGANLFKEVFNIKLVEKSTPTVHPVFATTRIGLKENGEFWNENYRFIRCSADYLCEVEGKTKLCEAIRGSKLKVEELVLERALSKPSKKRNLDN